MKLLNNELEDEILRCISPEYQQIFYTAIVKAIEKYEKLSASIPDTEFNKRTRANMINDFICENIKEEVKKYPAGKLYASEKYNALKLSIENGKILARFKKMSSAGATSNILTQQVLDFENQINLFYDKPTININVGYVYDGLDYKMLLSHPNGSGKIDWTYPLEPSAPGVTNMTNQTASNKSTPARIPKVRKGLGKDDIQKR